MPIPAGNMITIDARLWKQLSVRDARSRFSTYYPGETESGFIFKYENGVRKALDMIKETRSGQRLLEAIRNPITIVPMDDPTEDGAYARADDPRKAAEKGTPLKAQNSFGPVTVFAIGGGSSATIGFSPDTWTPGNHHYRNKWRKWNMLRGDAGQTADEVLFHELVHAVRMTHGKLNKNPMGDDYDEHDEFCAILLANIYISEKGGKLRSSHRAYHELAIDNKFPSEIYTRYTSPIEMCCRELPELTRKLAEVDCPFNPVREFYLYTMPVLGPLRHQLDVDQYRTIHLGPIELPTGPAPRPRRRR